MARPRHELDLRAFQRVKNALNNKQITSLNSLKHLDPKIFNELSRVIEQLFDYDYGTVQIETASFGRTEKIIYTGSDEEWNTIYLQNHKKVQGKHFKSTATKVGEWLDYEMLRMYEEDTVQTSLDLLGVGDKTEYPQFMPKRYLADYFRETKGGKVNLRSRRLEQYNGVNDRAIKYLTGQLTQIEWKIKALGKTFTDLYVAKYGEKPPTYTFLKANPVAISGFLDKTQKLLAEEFGEEYDPDKEDYGSFYYWADQEFGRDTVKHWKKEERANAYRQFINNQLRSKLLDADEYSDEAGETLQKMNKIDNLMKKYEERVNKKNGG